MVGRRGGREGSIASFPLNLASQLQLSRVGVWLVASKCKPETTQLGR